MVVGCTLERLGPMGILFNSFSMEKYPNAFLKFICLTREGWERKCKVGQKCFSIPNG